MYTCIIIYILSPPPWSVFLAIDSVFEAVGYGEIQRDTARYS